ncbi:MAG TPA: RNA-binding domain-containing protein [Verrucomicrobiae bacterium]|nr:RNA-binding domain-containing protein [Candidatus Sulfotelmatobacter sp.]HTV62522.1 RNA-binding domain-containing protein [Verrucomicrobiae bacterium]
MISFSQLEEWVRARESETLEFKRSTGERRAAAQTLCGMLNHHGGRVLFGVEADGRIVGQMVSDHTIEEAVQELKEIDPPVFPSIERVDVADGKQALVVTVAQGANRPYSYKGTAYRRVGNTTLELSRDEYHRMLLERLHGERRWENEPASGWAVGDMDTTEIIRTLEESIRRGRADDPGVRDPSEVLRGLGLMRDGRLLRAAVVLFGRSERLEGEMPQCLLRVARFRGRDKTEFLDNRQFHGNAFELLLRAERFMRENLPVAGRVQPGLFERVDDPLYPPVALREALANAVCHRDYSIGGGSIAVALYDDRLEITSSGTLHFGLTAEALFQPHESLPWNPLIARVFYRRGVIEAWGRGTIKMAELVTRAGLPRPEIEEVAGCVTVRFRPSRYVPPLRVSQDLTERQRRVLEVVGAGSGFGMALREIGAQLENLPPRAIREDLAVLKTLGLLKSTGLGRGARWRLA